MPYSGPDDPDIPKNVPKDKKAQWVEVFNSAFASCKKKGLKKVAKNPSKFKNCEAFAFANANGAIKRDKTMAVSPRQLLVEFFEKAQKFLYGEDVHRDMSMHMLVEKVFNAADELDEFPGFFIDIYRGANGDLFAVFVHRGKLFKSTLELDTDENLTLGTMEEVVQNFTPINTRTKTTIQRQSDGKHRWVSVSNTSVINKDGEIDSTKLMDSIVKNFTEHPDPLRMFFHKGSQFRVGICDFVAREGNVLITSGVYDDSEIAKAEIIAREKDPDYWSDSISYRALKPPRIESIGGIDVEVYEEGYLREISTLPADHAASYFTNSTSIFEEVDRKMNKTQWDAFVKLFGDDEKRAKEWLEGNVDPVNREIVESNAIFRNAEGTETEEEVETTPETDNEEETQEEISTEETQELEFEIDDQLLETIVSRVIASEQFNTRLEAIETSITGLTTAIGQLTGDLTESRASRIKFEKDVKEKITSLERSDDDKQRVWKEDLARNTPKTRVTFRPSQPQSNPSNGDEVDASLEDVAQETLSKFAS